MVNERHHTLFLIKPLLNTNSYIRTEFWGKNYLKTKKWFSKIGLINIQTASYIGEHFGLNWARDFQIGPCAVLQEHSHKSRHRFTV